MDTHMIDVVDLLSSSPSPSPSPSPTSSDSDLPSKTPITAIKQPMTAKKSSVQPPPKTVPAQKNAKPNAVKSIGARVPVSTTITSSTTVSSTSIKVETSNSRSSKPLSSKIATPSSPIATEDGDEEMKESGDDDDGSEDGDSVEYESDDDYYYGSEPPYLPPHKLPYKAEMAPHLKELKPTSDSDAYTVTDHAWYESSQPWWSKLKQYYKEQKKELELIAQAKENEKDVEFGMKRYKGLGLGPCPPIPADIRASTLRPATCEEACSENGMKVTRELIVKLKPETVKELDRAIGSKIGEYDKKVLQLCDSGELNKCGLFRSRKNEQFCILATAPIRDREPIGAYLGILQEKARFDKRVGSVDSISHIWGFDVDGAHMPSDYTGPELIVDASSYSNELRFVRDSRWTEHEYKANVESRLVWHRTKKLPYIVFVAVCHIEEGAEIYVDWGDSTLQGIRRIQLKALADNSQYLYKWTAALQKTLKAMNIPIPGVDNDWSPPHHSGTRILPSAESMAKLKDQPSTSLTAPSPVRPKKSHTSSVNVNADPNQLQVGCHWEEPAWDPYDSYTMRTVQANAIHVANRNENLRMERRKKRRREAALLRRVGAWEAEKKKIQLTEKRRPVFQFVDQQLAFDRSGCEIARESVVLLKPETIRALRKALEDTKKYARNESSLNLAPMSRVVIEEGTTPKAAIHEIISFRHPARYLTRPDCVAYCMVATQKIADKEAIGTYIGTFREQNTFHRVSHVHEILKQVYAYDVLASQLGKYYHGPDLVVESLRCGNECRFINDCFNRAYGDATVNAIASVVWDKRRGLPAVLLTAQETLHPGTELIVSYGSQFWEKVMNSLMIDHASYGDDVSVWNAEMEKLILEGGGELPSKPNRDADDYDLYDGSAVTYPAFMTRKSDAQNEVIRQQTLALQAEEELLAKLHAQMDAEDAAEEKKRQELAAERRRARRMSDSDSDDDSESDSMSKKRARELAEELRAKLDASNIIPGAEDQRTTRRKLAHTQPDTTLITTTNTVTAISTTSTSITHLLTASTSTSTVSLMPSLPR